MARFKAPKITTSQRMSLALELSELVYDTDQMLFYGGDGSTVGGVPIGAGVSGQTQIITLDSTHILNKKVTLSGTPLFPDNVTLLMAGGIHQFNGIDFEVVGNELRWNSLGLDGFVEELDIFLVQY
jgi:hypothetical protein